LIKFTPTPIGNLKDLSIRSKESFEWANIVLCEDTRVTKKLFLLLDIGIASKKFISVHIHNEQNFIDGLDGSFFNNNVIYCSDAGMPCISDPGAKIVDFCITNDIEYEVIPGANAALLTFCASGINDKEFLFYGFLPKKMTVRMNEIKELLSFKYASILYEAPHRIVKLLKEIVSIDKNREIFIAKEFTKIFETKYRGRADELKDIISSKSTKGEWVVMLIPKDSTDNVCKSDKQEKHFTKKDIAKLMSKISSKPVKECYNFLNMDI
jgi:16S rRNA (cytidine1402-2'-O)-methyltransferase